MEILDAYILSEPSDQNILDLFQGEWSSQLPAHSQLVTQPGTADLFRDPRIDWAETTLGRFFGKEILELGPLEGGHSYLLQNRGANRIVSIEANTRAFLKCLCVKEIFNLDRVEFKLGNFIPFLEKNGLKYDAVLASGVLYHMEEPLKLLELISKATDKVFIWTHYFDEEIILRRPEISAKFSPLNSVEYGGIGYEYSSQSYNEALGWAGFCGGSQKTSKWLTRHSLLEALKNFGFVNLEIGFDMPDHPNGPALAIAAKKASI
jgi:hypothetical protein